MQRCELFTLLAVMSALVLPACATVTRGPNVDFKIVSEPAGAAVVTTLKTPAMRKEERRQKDFLRYGVINEDEVTPIKPDYIGCDATPCSLSVARRSNFTTTVSLPGYHTATINVTSGFGKQGTGATAGGTAASIAGGYVVTHAAVTAMVSGITAITSALTASTAASTAASSTAASAASSAATGIGVTMIGVDLLSGAMLDLRPNPLVLVLVPDTEPVPEGNNALIDTPEKYEQLVAQYTATN